MQRPGFCAEQAPIFGDVTCGRALMRRPLTICVTLRFGFALSIRLTAPATIGAEKLLPNTRL